MLRGARNRGLSKLFLMIWPWLVTEVTAEALKHRNTSNRPKTIVQQTREASRRAPVSNKLEQESTAGTLCKCAL